MRLFFFVQSVTPLVFWRDIIPAISPHHFHTGDGWTTHVLGGFLTPQTQKFPTKQLCPSSQKIPDNVLFGPAAQPANHVQHFVELDDVSHLSPSVDKNSTSLCHYKKTLVPSTFLVKGFISTGNPLRIWQIDLTGKVSWANQYLLWIVIRSAFVWIFILTKSDCIGVCLLRIGLSVVVLVLSGAFVKLWFW